jgi:hypothetical protein
MWAYSIPNLFVLVQWFTSSPVTQCDPLSSNEYFPTDGFGLARGRDYVAVGHARGRTCLALGSSQQRADKISSLMEGIPKSVSGMWPN